VINLPKFLGGESNIEEIYGCSLVEANAGPWNRPGQHEGIGELFNELEGVLGSMVRLTKT